MSPQLDLRLVSRHSASGRPANEFSARCPRRRPQGARPALSAPEGRRPPASDSALNPPCGRPTRSSSGPTDPASRGRRRPTRRPRSSSSRAFESGGPVPGRLRGHVHLGRSSPTGRSRSSPRPFAPEIGMALYPGGGQRATGAPRTEKFGVSSRGGYDCSGFVWRVYKAPGLIRTTGNARLGAPTAGRPSR